MSLEIVEVQYKAKSASVPGNNPDEFGGRKYSYFTAIPLQVGDIVVAPAGNGETIAKVVTVDVPESKVDERVLPLLKTIERLYEPEADEVKRETIDETLAVLGEPADIPVVSPDEL